MPSRASLERWALVAVVAILNLSVSWLVLEVLSIRRDLVALQASYAVQLRSDSARLDRLMRSDSETRRFMGRIDRNIARICERIDVVMETP